MFRKNYVPKLEIRQEFGTGKWFAYVPGDVFDRAAFVQRGDSSYEVDYFRKPEQATRFDSLDSLMEAIYFYAYQNNLEHMKDKLTFNSVRLST